MGCRNRRGGYRRRAGAGGGDQVTTKTATAMQSDYDMLRVGIQGPDDNSSVKRTHVYEAQDRTALVINAITDETAHALETFWYGKRVADENYHIGSGASQ